jgi:hypothetical protein
MGGDEVGKLRKLGRILVGELGTGEDPGHVLADRDQHPLELLKASCLYSSIGFFWA